MIHVIDVCMGGGKTSAAITYMNEHPDDRYIYVTPFLDETERVVNACAGLHFFQPSDRIPEYHHKKSEHLRALANQRRNVAITHALFRMIDDVTARIIADAGYTIFIDEVIDVFEMVNETPQDVSMLISAGYLEQSGGDDECEYFRPTPLAAEYHGQFTKFFQRSQYGQLVRTAGWEDGEKVKYGFWEVNPYLFSLSAQVYVLTYMFDGMPMKGFLDFNHIAYDFLGTRMCEDGQYRFCPLEEMRYPTHLASISRMVHVCDKASINEIGYGKHDLSASWTKRGMKNGDVAVLSRHIHTYFRRHIPQRIGADQQLWSVYKDAVKEVKSRKPGGQFLVFNSEATNMYGDRAALAYCVNIFANPNMVRYLQHYGVNFDEERYATAVMVQWVWRSRIRNGQEIWVYIPSRRMRELFIAWMREVEQQCGREVTDGSE